MRKPRYPSMRGGYRGGNRMMNRMGGVMVYAARLGVGFGAMSAIITTSQNLGGK
jgi:hypothetical protein